MQRKNAHLPGECLFQGKSLPSPAKPSAPAAAGLASGARAED